MYRPVHSRCTGRIHEERLRNTQARRHNEERLTDLTTAHIEQNNVRWKQKRTHRIRRNTSTIRLSSYSWDLHALACKASFEHGLSKSAPLKISRIRILPSKINILGILSLEISISNISSEILQIKISPDLEPPRSARSFPSKDQKEIVLSLVTRQKII